MSPCTPWILPWCSRTGFKTGSQTKMLQQTKRGKLTTLVQYLLIFCLICLLLILNFIFIYHTILWHWILWKLKLSNPLSFILSRSANRFLMRSVTVYPGSNVPKYPSKNANRFQGKKIALILKVFRGQRYSRFYLQGRMYQRSPAEV